MREGWSTGLLFPSPDIFHFSLINMNLYYVPGVVLSVGDV